MDHSQDSRLLQVDGLILDTQKRLVTNGKGEWLLTQQECQLLSIFMQYPGMVLNRAFLMQLAWGWEISEPAQARTLEVYVHHLRQKLENDPGKPKLIRTVRGVGYRFGR